MNWKEIIESLKKENSEAFAAYEKSLKEGLAADVEKKVMEKLKANKTDEAKLRKDIEAELQEQNKEKFERLEALEAYVAGAKKLIGESGDPAEPAADAENKKIKEQAAASAKALEVEKAKNKELAEQLSERERKHAVGKKIADVTKDHKHAEMLVERLQNCASVEDVETRFKSESEFIAKLLTEKKEEKPEGKGKVNDQSDDGDDNKWTESQRQQRRAIGLPA